jgi:hypothetical protein
LRLAEKLTSSAGPLQASMTMAARFVFGFREEMGNSW